MMSTRLKDEDENLEKAREFHRKAIEEFKRAKEDNNNDVLFRDAAEKGWNAIVKATNYLILTMGKLPKTHKNRRDQLWRIGEENGAMKRYKLYERFNAREHILHELCFYDGIYEIDQVEYNIKKVKSYIKDIEKLTKGDRAKLNPEKSESKKR